MSKKPTFLQRCKAAAESNADMADLLERRLALVRLSRDVDGLSRSIQMIEARMREELELMAP